MKKDSNGAVYCKCGHPEWAHQKTDGYTNESGTHWPGDIEHCNWDIDTKCKCKMFKADWDS